MTLYAGLILSSTDTFLRTLSISISININGTISFDGILKHQKCIRKYFVNSFHSNSYYVLHDNRMSSNVFFLAKYPPLNYICQYQQYRHVDDCSSPLILVDTISGDLTMVKYTFFTI